MPAAWYFACLRRLTRKPGSATNEVLAVGVATIPAAASVSASPEKAVVLQFVDQTAG